MTTLNRMDNSVKMWYNEIVTVSRAFFYLQSYIAIIKLASANTSALAVTPNNPSLVEVIFFTAQNKTTHPQAWPLRCVVKGVILMQLSLRILPKLARYVNPSASNADGNLSGGTYDKPIYAACVLNNSRPFQPNTEQPVYAHCAPDGSDGSVHSANPKTHDNGATFPKPRLVGIPHLPLFPSLLVGLRTAALWRVAVQPLGVTL